VIGGGLLTEAGAPESATVQSETAWSQQQKLTAAAGASGDAFGGAVSLAGDGTTALIGASTDTTSAGENAGAAYVFTRRGGSWRQQQQLAPSDGEARDGFGISVALSHGGETALVGAANDETPDGRRAGSAYVFARGDGGWRQQQKLRPADAAANDLFGRSAAVSDDGATALVGAPFTESPNAKRTGSAYVFTRGDGGWRQQQKLPPAEGTTDGVAGLAASLSGDGTTALVGAPGQETSNGVAAGVAHMFTRGDEEWRPQQQLVAAESNRNDLFGIAVSLSRDGSTGLVGARNDELAEGGRGGSTYVFTRRSNQWQQQRRLVAPDSDGQDGFGGAVSLSSGGATALVGAAGDEDPNGAAAGVTHVFTRGDQEWRHQQQLAATDGDSEDAFGRSISLARDGARALIGAWFDEDPNGQRAGSAYVFASGDVGSPSTTTADSPTTPTPTPTLTPSATDTAEPSPDSPAASPTEVTTGSGAGFGGLAAAGAIGTLSYLLHRERRSEEER
jgi:hypothetical protein